MNLDLLDVIIPIGQSGVLLSDDMAENGLFFVFTKENEFVGVVQYDPELDCYTIETETNGYKYCSGGKARETLIDFYQRLQEKIPGSYLKYVETKK